MKKQLPGNKRSRVRNKCLLRQYVAYQLDFVAVDMTSLREVKAPKELRKLQLQNRCAIQQQTDGNVNK